MADCKLKIREPGLGDIKREPDGERLEKRHQRYRSLNFLPHAAANNADPRPVLDEDAVYGYSPQPPRLPPMDDAIRLALEQAKKPTFGGREVYRSPGFVATLPKEEEETIVARVTRGQYGADSLAALDSRARHV